MIILVHYWIPKILSSIIVGLSTHSYREQRISISWAWCYSHLCTSIMGPWCPRFKTLFSASWVAPTDIALSWLLLRPSISMRLVHVTNHPVRDGLVIISLYLEQNITYESMSYLMIFSSLWCLKCWQKYIIILENIQYKITKHYFYRKNSQELPFDA